MREELVDERESQLSEVGTTSVVCMKFIGAVRDLRQGVLISIFTSLPMESTEKKKVPNKEGRREHSWGGESPYQEGKYSVMMW